MVLTHNTSQYLQSYHKHTQHLLTLCYVTQGHLLGVEYVSKKLLDFDKESSRHFGIAELLNYKPLLCVDLSSFNDVEDTLDCILHLFGLNFFLFLFLLYLSSQGSIWI